MLVWTFILNVQSSCTLLPPTPKPIFRAGGVSPRRYSCATPAFKRPLGQRRKIVSDAQTPSSSAFGTLNQPGHRGH